MPIGSTVVYNPGDLILHNVSSSGNTFQEVKIAAATSSIILFNANGLIGSQSLNSTTVGTASSLVAANSYTASNLQVTSTLLVGSISASSFIIASSFTGSLAGTASWSNNALTAALATSINFTASNSTTSQTASYLTTTNSYTVANLTASNISASGTGSFGYVGIGTTSPSSNLEVSGQIGVSAGSEPSPAYAFAGDLDTGFYRPAANQLRIVTGGASRASFTSTEIRVGNNLSNLDIGAESKFIIVGSENTPTLDTLIASLGFSNASNQAGQTSDEIAKILVTCQDATTNQGRLEFQTKNGTSLLTRMMIDKNGNVGVGTSSPNTLLNVGSGTPSTAANGIQFGSDTSANLYRISTGVIKTDGGLTVGGTTTTVNALSASGINVNGNISASSFTGSVFGTSSWATNVLTASYVSSSNIVGTVTSASYASSASYALSSSLATTAGALVTTNNYTVNNLTASNISASATGSFGMVGIGTSTIQNAITIGVVDATSSCLLIQSNNYNNLSNGIQITSQLGALNGSSCNLHFARWGGGYYTDHASVGQSTGPVSYDLQFCAGQQNTGSAINYFTSSAVRMTIKTSTGNVGIGTTSPNALLNVGSGTPSTAANGIQFGSDTSANLYRLATGAIKTDGGLTVVGAMYVQGTTNCAAIAASSISSSGAIIASSFTGSHFGTSSWATNSVTASYLVPTNNYTVNNITASGGIFTNDITVNGLTIGKGSGSNISNTAIGVATLQNNYSSASVGVSNTAVGSSALVSSTSGSYNTALGHLSEYFNTLGDYNTAVGYASLYSNTIGTRNVAVGAATLFLNVSGEYNTALGYQSTYGNIAGLGNTGIGYRTLFSKSSGGYNTAIGHQASSNLTTGSNNIAIGYNAQLSNITSSNEIVIGDNNITLLRIPALGISATTSTLSATNISASGFVSASVFVGAASSLVATNSYQVVNLTASNISASTITSSNVIINGNLTVTGSIFASLFSASNIYITSSTLVVTDNIITINALSPYQRYAGLEMYDSGSGTLSSFLWDSINNYFFVSSSDAGASRQIILGPTGEASLTANYIPLISGSNNLTSSVIYQSGSNIGIGTTTPLSKFVVNGGTVNTSSYTTSESRIADGSIHLMKTVAGGVFESIRAMNMDTTVGTTVRVLAASTSDPFNNANGGKVFIDAIRTSTNMDLAFSLNNIAGAAAV